MGEETMVEFVQEWQTGAFLLLGSAAVGVITAVVVGSRTTGFAGLLGFFLAAVLAFLAFSYGLYGR